MIIYKQDLPIKINKHNSLGTIPTITFKHVLTGEEFVVEELNIDVGTFFYTIRDFTPEKDGEFQYSVLIDDELMESGIMQKGLSTKPTEENLSYVYE